MGTPRRIWTDPEVALLRKNYPQKGGPWCAERLVRPLTAIQDKAQLLGLCSATPRGGKTLRVSSGLIDEAIRTAYRQPKGTGAIDKVVRQYGVSRTYVSRRALKIGARTVLNITPWSEEEIEILRQNAQASNKHISRLLAERGYRRTPSAVKTARSSGEVDRTESELHTTGDVARLLGVCPATPCSWVKRGLLTPEPGTGAGEARVLISDLELARFIVTNPAAINLPKIEPSKEWFIDLLVRKGALALLSRPRSKRDAILQAALANPEMSRRQLAELLEMEPKIVTVVMSKLRSEGLLPDAKKEAA